MTTQNINNQKAESRNGKYENLEKYSRNLVSAARAGKLDPVIGRDDEIRRILQILSRRTKNNPVLIGEPGTGKTAIVEGLAERIVRGDVPENLKDKLVYSLDMGALVAGAMYKGEFEDRLKKVVGEVVESGGQVILFIDEIHTLVGAGKGEGAMDAANILKPALARGELRAIGATTLDEYQKYFEKDKALERRFQTILVDEPDEQAAISILRGLKEKYESHHKVRIKDDACIAAVRLSVRYISERFLPDKAIDLIDEAAAKLRMERDSVPEELDELVRRLQQLEIERECIRRENDTQKEKQLTEEINALRVKEYEMRTQWEKEKELANKIQRDKDQIERLKLEAQQAERDGNYARVAEIRYGILRRLEEEVQSAERRVQSASAQPDSEPCTLHSALNAEVTADDIADVVSRWTGIPVSRMLQSEREKLLHIEEELHKRVIGQREAVDAVANGIRRSRAGLQDAKRPISSFLFLGSTGVGKTELAKALAEYLFNDEASIVRIDMSEYQEKHTVSRLIGAPPGYVGYDEGGALTEAVRRRPYSVVLFDEIEKAHPDVFNILLQVLDDGRLTDNKGRTVNFKNTIIIMTSNLGSEIDQDHKTPSPKLPSPFSRGTCGDSIAEGNQKKSPLRGDLGGPWEALALLKQRVRPEFLNRIDETILFHRLDRQEVRQIVELQVTLLYRMLREQDIELRVTPEAIDYLAEAGYDPEFGARPVKRAIQQHLLNALSRDILAGRVNAAAPVVVRRTDSGLAFC